jgi:dolichyl-phosphate beta-glucosyltransferase
MSVTSLIRGSGPRHSSSGRVSDGHPAETGASINREPVDLEVVVPAYNEEYRLPRTIARTVEFLAERPWKSRVVVVDNGSVDATPGVVDRFAGSSVDVEIVGCAQPGKGAAVRRGVLTGRSAVVGYMDADLATPVETIDAVMDRLQHGADVVVASRRTKGARFEVDPTLVRRAGTLAFRILTHRLVPDTSDTQCGFKFFQGHVGRQIMRNIVTTGFAFDVEVLARAHRAGFTIEEVPVRWTAVDGSRFHPIRDGVPSFLAAARIYSVLSNAEMQAP